MLYREQVLQTNAEQSPINDLIPKMNVMVINEVDDKQKQRLESFLRMKKELDELKVWFFVGSTVKFFGLNITFPLLTVSKL